jgi:HD-GYP domain-containing protein (c-di-GMP phosphodiesterase class II)
MEIEKGNNTETDQVLLEIHVETLLPGMILEADAFTADGVKKINKEEAVTEELINKLKSEKLEILFYNPVESKIEKSYKLITMETKDLYPGIALQGDAFTPDGTKIVGRGEIITAEIIKSLEDMGIHRFNYNKPVYSSNFYRIDRYIVSNQLIEKSLYVAKEIENSILKKISLPKKEIEDVIEDLIGEISISETYTILNLLKLKDFDDYTYTHSINVAMLAILFGKEMLYSKDKLKILGEGAILHDLGKLLIPKEILNKKEELNQKEWFTIQKHPQLGYEIIQTQKNFDREVEDCLLYHHENYDGLGYPTHIARDKMGEIAQVIAIADTYDALTSETPYRKAFPISNSFLAIQNLSGTKFHPRFAAEFINRMPRRLYGKPLVPLDSFVMLNTKEVAQVLKIDPSQTLRPIILIYINSKMETLKYPLQVDLLLDKTRSIEKIIEDPKLLQALENMRKV